MNRILAPSLLAADFGHLEDQIKAVEAEGASYLHLDVMDGAFVPSISFGMPVLSSLRPKTGLVFDVHMMVEEPGRYIEAMRRCGADLITVHAEACTHLDRVISQIKEAGCRAGAALNPATPLSALDCILGELDMVLIMTVNPGFGGQRFIPYTLEKVRTLRRSLTERGLDTDLEVDGGVTPANAEELLAAGANVLVAGSSVFRGDPGENVRRFMKVFKEHER